MRYFYYCNIYFKSKICSSPAEGFRATSLCPVLGKKHAQVFSGMCPWHTVNPIGKMLQVSFLGGRPYINYLTYPIGGTDFILTRLFAKKHGFFPEFIHARNLDIVKSNGTTTGLIHSVRKVCNKY